MILTNKRLVKWLFLVDDSSGHKKAKGENKNVVATISQNEYSMLSNQKHLRHSMSRIRSKNQKTETYKINISL